MDEISKADRVSFPEKGKACTAIVLDVSPGGHLIRPEGAQVSRWQELPPETTILERGCWTKL